MVDEAVAKAGEIGVSENVAVLDDGGNLKAFNRMDGAPIQAIEMLQGDPSLLIGIPTLSRVAAWGGGFPIKVNGKIVGAIRAIRVDYLLIILRDFAVGPNREIAGARRQR